MTHLHYPEAQAGEYGQITGIPPLLAFQQNTTTVIMYHTWPRNLISVPGMLAQLCTERLPPKDIYKCH